MTLTRFNGSDRGWTAIGIGSEMAGALMFIIYGDPVADEAPIVSIRGASGHHQPSLITRSTIGGSNFRVLRAAWIAEESKSTSNAQSYVAHVELPWMWAWNPDQELSVYTYDAKLTMHKHRAGAGGWGNFYVDMPYSINHSPMAPSVPPIRPGVAAVGATDTPSSIGWMLTVLATNSAWHVHGVIMGVAFLLLFPSGIVALKSGSSRSFKYHWMLQLAASLTVWLGVVFGLFLRKAIDTAHQRIGIAIAICLGVQGVLGCWNHIVFLRVRRRTWLSHAHVWLGRLVMMGGWSNLVTGMSLRGYHTLPMFLTGLAGSLQLLGLTFLVWWAYSRGIAKKVGVEEQDKAVPGWSKTDGHYFALTDHEGEEDSESESESTLITKEDRGMLSDDFSLDH